MIVVVMVEDLVEGGGCRVIEVSLVAERVMTGPDCVWFRLWQL